MRWSPLGVVVGAGVLFVGGVTALVVAHYEGHPGVPQPAPASASPTTTTVGLGRPTSTLAAPPAAGLQPCEPAEFTLRAPGLDVASHRARGWLYLEPRDGVACRLATTVRVRLLAGRRTLADQTVATTMDTQMHAGAGNGTALSVDVRHWLSIQITTGNDEGPPDFAQCLPSHSRDPDRVVLDFAGGTLQLATRNLGGCGALTIGPVQPVGAQAALDDITFDRH